MTPSIAICYWGMTRSIRHVYQSHHTNLFNVLKEHGYTTDVYIHSWKTDVNKIWQNTSPVPIDYEEYKLLEPIEYKLDEQLPFLDSITFSDYFYEYVYKAFRGEHKEGEWIPELIQNHLCALESQKRVTRMVLQSGKSYKYILYIRPDVEIKTKFPVECLSFLQPKECCIVNYDHNDGYNDKFAVMHLEDCIPYSHRIDELKEFRRLYGRIVSEKCTKYIFDKCYGKIHQIDFKFELVRPTKYII